MNRLLAGAALAAVVSGASGQSISVMPDATTVTIGDTITFTVSVDIAGNPQGLDRVTTFSGSLAANDDTLGTASDLVFSSDVVNNSFAGFPNGGGAISASIGPWDWSQDQIGGALLAGPVTFGTFTVVADAAGTLTYTLGAGPNPNLIEGSNGAATFLGPVGEPVANGSVAFNTMAVTINPAPMGCNPADLVAPFGILNSSDINAFVAAFLANTPEADLAAPAGIFNSSDINAFVSAFLAGCP